MWTWHCSSVFITFHQAASINKQSKVDSFFAKKYWYSVIFVAVMQNLSAVPYSVWNYKQYSADTGGKLKVRVYLNTVDCMCTIQVICHTWSCYYLTSTWPAAHPQTYITSSQVICPNQHLRSHTVSFLVLTKVRSMVINTSSLNYRYSRVYMPLNTL